MKLFFSSKYKLDDEKKFRKKWIFDQICENIFRKIRNFEKIHGKKISTVDRPRPPQYPFSTTPEPSIMFRTFLHYPLNDQVDKNHIFGFFRPKKSILKIKMGVQYVLLLNKDRGGVKIPKFLIVLKKIDFRKIEISKIGHKTLNTPKLVDTLVGIGRSRRDKTTIFKEFPVRRTVRALDAFQWSIIVPPLKIFFERKRKKSGHDGLCLDETNRMTCLFFLLRRNSGRKTTYKKLP